MTATGETGPVWGPEDSTPFERAVEVVEGFLDSPLTQCYEFSDPVEVGKTNEITFGKYGASKHVGPRGDSYRVRTTFGPLEDDSDTVWILDPTAPNPGERARVGRQRPMQVASDEFSDLRPMSTDDYLFLTGGLPAAFADAQANKHIGYPRQPLMARLGWLAARFGLRSH